MSRFYYLGSTRVDLDCVLEHLEDYLINGGVTEFFEPFGIDFIDSDYDVDDLQNELDNAKITYTEDYLEDLFDLYIKVYDHLTPKEFIDYLIEEHGNFENIDLEDLY